MGVVVLVLLPPLLTAFDNDVNDGPINIVVGVVGMIVVMVVAMLQMQ